MTTLQERDAILAVASSYHCSPFYLYFLDKLRAQCRELRAALSGRPLLLYAMKANAAKPILQCVLEEGFGLECVSLGEVMAAVRLGASRILFTNTNISSGEFADVLELSKRRPPGTELWVNCDSIQRLRELPPGAETFLRINGPVGAGHHAHVVTCGPDSKFGIQISDLPEALALAASKGVRVVGLHQHIGSGIRDPDTYVLAMSVLLDVAIKFKASLMDLRYVDVGGGIGVPYRPRDPAVNVPELGRQISSVFAAFQHAFCDGGCVSAPQLMLEPGRFIVAECGYLVARVTALKVVSGREFAGVDTGAFTGTYIDRLSYVSPPFECILMTTVIERACRI
jgi:diaminopimelate decarboxylase